MKLSKITKLLDSDLEDDLLIAYYMIKRKYRKLWIFNIVSYFTGYKYHIRRYGTQIEFEYNLEYFCREWIPKCVRVISIK